MKANEQVSLIGRVRAELSQLKVDNIDNTAREMIFHCGVGNAKLVVQQYCFLRLVGIGLNRSILAAKGGSRLPYHVLPKAGRAVLKNHGIPNIEFLSSIAWRVYILSLWAYGIYKILEKLASSNDHRDYEDRRSHAHFLRLSSNNLPKNVLSGLGYDLLSWYARTEFPSERTKFFTHELSGGEVNKVGSISMFKT